MITQKELKELLIYDSETGIFTNKITRNPRAKIGVQLKANNLRGKYGQVGINKQHYLLHRLAWLYMTGSWPKNQIDHINGSTTDNRFCNLRDVTNQQNQFNSISKTGSSKFKGIFWNTDRKVWSSQIKINGKYKYLGKFDKEEDAALAYNNAALELFGEYAKLNKIEE